MLVTRGIPKHHKKHRLPLFLFIVASLFLLRTTTTSELTSAAELPANNSQEISVQLEEVSSRIVVKPGASKPQVYAKYILLMDGETGDVLYSKDGDVSIPIASTTKMVTALTAMKEMDLKAVTTISKKPPMIQGSKINLLSGEKITIGDLLKGLLINSGNDTAFAIAEAYANEPGNYEKFVAKMNEYLRSHGLERTVLADPAGLDDEKGRSTCRELAHIARLLLKNKVLADIVSTPQATIASVDGSLQHDLKNTNRLIQSDTSYYLPNVLGVKTGFTHEAGHSLVAAYKLNGRLLIGVVMNTVEYTNTASAAEMKKLFLWAEQNVAEESYL